MLAIEVVPEYVAEACTLAIEALRQCGADQGFLASETRAQRGADQGFLAIETPLECGAQACFGSIESLLQCGADARFNAFDVIRERVFPSPNQARHGNRADDKCGHDGQPAQQQLHRPELRGGLKARTITPLKMHAGRT